MGIPNCLGKYQDLIINDMHAFLDGSDRNHVKMIYYHLGWMDRDFKPVNISPGKLSRPSITLLVTETLHGSVEESLPLATAIQLFHDFTLMHDDIEDGDPMRRYRDTVWGIWDIPRAINAGDALYTYSLQAILRVSKNRELVLAYLLGVYQEIVYGQELDLSFMYAPISTVKTSDYLQMISGKSAVLLGASAKAGAIMADADEAVQESFYQFGFNLGVAYQVFDDYMSIWGSSKNSGKVEHMDIVDKKKTLPILLLFEAVNTVDRELLNTIYDEKQISPTSVEKVLELLGKYNIKQGVLEKLTGYKAKAEKALQDLSLPKTKESCFNEILNWLLPEVKDSI